MGSNDHKHTHGRNQGHSHDHGANHCDHDHGINKSDKHAEDELTHIKLRDVHSHHHDHAHGVVGNIRFAFVLNFSFSLIELVGGLAIGSMAIVAGAIHDLGDSLSLGSAWGLERYAKRGKDSRFNFGYRRFSLLSALVSGVVISTGSIIIIYESIARFGTKQSPPGMAMVGFALLGVTINGIAAWRLSRGATLNERMLTWHQLEDLASWAIVLIAGVVLLFIDIPWLDPALAIGLAIIVLFNVLRHLKSTAYLFLQGRPGNFDEAQFLREALAVVGIEHIDHLAVWSLDGETNILSARLHLHSVRDPSEIERVKADVRAAALRQQAQATLETCLAAHVPHGDEKE